MNLPEKLKLVKCSKDYPYKFILANTQESVTIDARKLGAEEQLKADQETYTQALEKIKELEAIEESHRKLNGELRERIKELEEEYKKLLATSAESTKKLLELIPTKEEAELFLSRLETQNLITFKDVAPFSYNCLAELQKIIEKEK